MVSLLVLNVLFICLAAYGLWGAFWVWQPGANPPQWAPLFGSLSHLRSIRAQGDNATIIHGFLSYRISIDGALSPPFLDWTQFFLLLLVVLDASALLYYYGARIFKSIRRIPADTDEKAP